MLRMGWLLVLAGVPQPDLRGNPLSAELEHVEFADATLAEATAHLQERSREADPSGRGANIVFDPAVDQERPVSLRLGDVSIGSALICLVDHVELDCRLDSHAFVVVPPGRGELARKRKRDDGASSLSSHAKRARRLVLDRVEFDEAPLANVLRHLVDESRQNDPEQNGFNLVINRTVDPKLPVTLRMEKVSASEVLGRIAQLTGVEIRDEPYAIFIDPPGTRALHRAERIRTRREAKARARRRAPQNSGRESGDVGGRIPADPRSPAHPDYIGSKHPNPSKRTNSLNNVYKWVDGEWTFVRHGVGDTSSPDEPNTVPDVFDSPSLEPAE